MNGALGNFRRSPDCNFLRISCDGCDYYQEVKMSDIDKDMNKKPQYSIEVYDDHAIIRGWLTSNTLVSLIKICELEGFKYLTHTDDGSKGFKLVRDKKESK